MLVSRRIALALVVVCLALSGLVSAAQAAGPATVTVRVEGSAATLLPPTQVTTTTEPVVKDGNPAHSCPGTSALGALQLATGGNWSGPWEASFGQYEIFSIEGESHPFSGGAFWELWVNHVSSEVGACEAQLAAGEEVLFFPECFGECPAAPNPLGIEAPAVAEVGKPVTATVISYANPSGAASPAGNATVVYDGTEASTDSSGHATLTFSHTGRMEVKVTAPGSIRTETTVCVHNGSDGNCGTQTSSGSGGSAGGTTTAGAAVVPFKGPYALVPHVTGLVDGHVYTRAHAPRILAGSVLAHTTVSSISLTLRREYRHRCYAFNGVTTQFVRVRCDTGKPFKVSGNSTFSYLLPSALQPGRYVLDIQATDAAGNRTTLARGTSRIVFYVR
ncbi:MAG TPA: hypothetical protein VG053_06675 [Solirubrobacteraceae bacterium]|jgi:hypothetical protein|nr:hypothetical protein [Solirubrobacteraceae bacterium]